MGALADALRRHGAEMRLSAGATPYLRATALGAALKRKLASLTELGPGILVEDKDYSLALHYRLAPDMETELREAVETICAQAPNNSIEILPGKDGLCHISELAEGYVASVGEVCKVGDEFPVKVIAIDDQDRVKLSRKAALKDLNLPDDKAPTGGREGRDGGSHGNRDGGGGGRDREGGRRGGGRGRDRDR